MKKFFPMFLLGSLVLLSGCGLVPQGAIDKMSGWMKTPANYVPYDRVDIFNNSVKPDGHKTYFTLSDRGGDKPQPIFTGEKGWVPQNTYFASNGYDQVDDDTITIRFYDADTNEYLGLCQYQISAGGPHYQAIHVYYEPKSAQYGGVYAFVVRAQ